MISCPVGIETAFREMKYNLGIVNLYGKSQQFAVQEIVAAMLLANFTARVVNEVVMEKASWVSGKCGIGTFDLQR